MRESTPDLDGPVWDLGELGLFHTVTIYLEMTREATSAEKHQLHMAALLAVQDTARSLGLL